MNKLLNVKYLEWCHTHNKYYINTAVTERVFLLSDLIQFCYILYISVFCFTLIEDRA